MAQLRRVDLAVEHRRTSARSRDSRSRLAGAAANPLGRAAREPVGDRGVVELVEQPGIDQLDFVRIEMSRRSAESREVEALRELVERGDRLDRLRRADPREHVEQRHRLDTLLA